MIETKQKQDILDFLHRENMHEKIRLANTIKDQELREDVLKNILIEKFREEMLKRDVTLFIPFCYGQFRVEMPDGSHVYADFLGEIKTEDDLQKLIASIDSELKMINNARQEIEKQGDDYWHNANNFI